MRKLSLIFAAWISVAANAQVVSEHDMKAAYLYNFAYLFEWPESRRANFHVCVVGDDDVGTAMLAYDARRVNGQRLVIARLSTLAPIRLCDIVYVGASELGNLPKIRSMLGGLPTLVVADKAPQPAASIALALDNKHLMFDVNLDQCERVNLKPRQTLLDLARYVRKAPETEARGAGSSH